jgi:DNA-binding FadR family transcriptional regulator
MREYSDSDFLRYLVEEDLRPGDRLPPLSELSQEIGISTGKLREQLEVARTFAGEATFEQFSQLRQKIESSMWPEAVKLLQPEDKEMLDEIVSSAWEKLRGRPIHIPNGEHRLLHLTIFSRLDNPFVQALLTAYWDAYEATELTRFADYQYWLDVWSFHEEIVLAIKNDDIIKGQQLLVEHFQLLPTAPLPT